VLAILIYFSYFMLLKYVTPLISFILLLIWFILLHYQGLGRKINRKIHLYFTQVLLIIIFLHLLIFPLPLYLLLPQLLQLITFLLPQHFQLILSTFWLLQFFSLLFPFNLLLILAYTILNLLKTLHPSFYHL
jgi:hypothetical protein